LALRNPTQQHFFVVICLFVCFLLTKTGARNGDLNYSAFEESVYNETSN